MAEEGDEEALRRAIWRTPDDDLVRLVFADWLEERQRPEDGDRAEFIRLQIARDAAGDPQPGAREATLLLNNWHRWAEQDLGALPPDFTDTVANLGFVRFRRGFVSAMSVTQEQFDRHADRWAGRLRLEGLTLRGPCDVEHLGSHPIVRGLRELGLRHCRVGDAGLHTLARAPIFSDLRVIDLAYNDATAAGLNEFLSREGGWPELVALDLSSNQIGDAGAGYLGRTTALPGVVRLSVDRCELGRDGAGHLAVARALQGLKWLSVSDNALVYPDVLRLLRSPHLPRLEAVECLLPNRPPVLTRAARTSSPLGPS